MAVFLFGKLISTEENLSEFDNEKVFLHSIETVKAHLGQHALKTDICVEALAYLSLKEKFKKNYLIHYMPVISTSIDSLSY